MKHNQVKKLQFGGWNKRDFKEIRSYLKRMLREQME